jgi:hypothetical protein
MFIIDQFQATDTDGNALESSEETVRLPQARLQHDVTS